MSDPRELQGQTNDHTVALLPPTQNGAEEPPENKCQNRLFLVIWHACIFIYGLALYYTISAKDCKSNCDSLTIGAIVAWSILALPIVLYIGVGVVRWMWYLCRHFCTCYVSMWQSAM